MDSEEKEKDEDVVDPDLMEEDSPDFVDDEQADLI